MPAADSDMEDNVTGNIDDGAEVDAHKGDMMILTLVTNNILYSLRIHYKCTCMSRMIFILFQNLAMRLQI